MGAVSPTPPFSVMLPITYARARMHAACPFLLPCKSGKAQFSFTRLAARSSLRTALTRRFLPCRTRLQKVGFALFCVSACRSSSLRTIPTRSCLPFWSRLQKVEFALFCVAAYRNSSLLTAPTRSCLPCWSRLPPRQCASVCAPLCWLLLCWR